MGLVCIIFWSSLIRIVLGPLWRCCWRLWGSQNLKIRDTATLGLRLSIQVFGILIQFIWLHDIQSALQPRDENKLSECSCYQRKKWKYIHREVVCGYGAVKIVSTVTWIVTVLYVQNVKTLMFFILTHVVSWLQNLAEVYRIKKYAVKRIHNVLYQMI
jgi:hypothetical protein